jgi:hypothetical protein
MKKIIELIKKLIKVFIDDWKEETPKVWARVRNIAGAITVAIPILEGVTPQFPSFQPPTWFIDYGWYIAGICLLITGLSGKQKKK